MAVYLLTFSVSVLASIRVTLRLIGLMATLWFSTHYTRRDADVRDFIDVVSLPLVLSELA